MGKQGTSHKEEDKDNQDTWVAACTCHTYQEEDKSITVNMAHPLVGLTSIQRMVIVKIIAALKYS